MARNLYTTVTELNTRLGLTASATVDAQLESWAEMASRWVDNATRRYFFTRNATLYADTYGQRTLILPEDAISLSALTTDSEWDGTYDGETWVENSDYWLWPAEPFPKLQVHTTAFGDFDFDRQRRRFVKMVGVWGYGDETSDPWADSGAGGEIATTGGTLLNVSNRELFSRGMTIRMDSEQMYVSLASGTGAGDITVARGVNGSTAATHSTSGTTIEIAQYPPNIKHAAEVLASRYRAEDPGGDLESEQIGDYRYKRSTPSNQAQRDEMLVASFVKRQVFR